MKHLLPLLALLLLGAGIPDRPPEPLSVSSSEQSKLAARKVVVRLEQSGTGGYTVGIVDMAAPIEAAWDALLDVKARVADVGSLKSADIYLQEPARLGTRWVIGVMGMSVQFHIIYEIDRDAGWVRYRLDTSKPNDLVDVQGAYQLIAQGDGTRLIYRSVTDSGRRVPQWIKNWLASGSLTEQMTGIRDRAEAAR